MAYQRGDVDSNLAPSVVVGVDGSAPSDLAVRWAARWASDTNCRLVIAHAVRDTRNPGVVTRGDGGDRLARAAGWKVTGHAVDLARAVAPGLDIEARVPLADPRELLLRLSVAASMVVVGAKGGSKRSSVGSIGAALAAHARCLVAVVRSGPRDEQDPVVAGVDLGPATSGVLELAFDLAECQGRPLEVLHCRQQAGPVGGRFRYPTWLRETSELENLLEEAVRLHVDKHPHVTCQRHVTADEPVPALVDRSAAAAVVVVGARGLPWPRLLIGSVGRGVVERGHSTVVVVRQ